MDGVLIEPMSEEFLLWRCLHGGPLSRETIDRRPADPSLNWERYRRRNLPLLARLTRAYGSCAITARDGERIVGMVRFYPKAVWETAGAGELCLQQDHPAGPADDFADADFPPLARIGDKTLKIHCLMTGSPRRAENPYQRRGLATKMMECLIRWAKDEGWERIEADALEDLPIVYEITGGAGRAFWEKLGFSAVERHPYPDLESYPEFLKALDEQAARLGIPLDRARDKSIMRLDLRDAA
jgi:GNAT superfamily N-acetyltransferase